MFDGRFGANRLNHGDDFLPNVSDGNSREPSHHPNQPPKPARKHNTDAWGKWFNQNPSKIGEDVTIPANTPSKRCDINAPDQEPIHIITPDHPKGDNRSSSLISTWDRWGEKTVIPSTLKEPSRSSSTINSDHLRNDINNALPSPSLVSTMSNQWRQTSAKPPTLETLETSCPYSKLNDPLRSFDFEFNKCEEARRLLLTVTPEPSPAKTTITQQLKVETSTNDTNVNSTPLDHNQGCSINKRQCYQHKMPKGQPSSALQKVALLRRCHFPKRDVIKWIGGTMDLTWLSCEVTNSSYEINLFIQEPLKRLCLLPSTNFGADLTCVKSVQNIVEPSKQVEIWLTMWTKSPPHEQPKIRGICYDAFVSAPAYFGKHQSTSA
jgi:hypothetical protein